MSDDTADGVTVKIFLDGHVDDLYALALLFSEARTRGFTSSPS